MEESWNRLFLLRELKQKEKAQKLKSTLINAKSAVSHFQYILRQTDGLIKQAPAMR